MRLERPLDVALGPDDDGQVVQDLGDVGMVGPDDSLPDRQRAPVVGLGRRIVLSLARDDAEILKRGGPEVAVFTEDLLANCQ